MRIAALALGGLGVLLVLPGLLWLGHGLYVEWIVARSPSTIALVRTEEGMLRLGAYKEGDQVMPSDSGLPPSPSSSPATVASLPGNAAPPPPVLNATAIPTISATPRSSRPILPPTRLRIAKIGVDAPVVLADNDNLPQFKGVGWYIGSGFPGFRGNVVLFGHVNGDYETFGRLDELKRGDAVTIGAMERTYSYTVTESKVVPKDAAEVMAPTGDYRVTLITCTGTFYPATRDYSHRVVVVAKMAAD